MGFKGFLPITTIRPDTGIFPDLTAATAEKAQLARQRRSEELIK
jgi:hypothetical protein